MPRSLRFFDHTGDFGVVLEAPGLGGLAELLVRAFLELLIEVPAAVHERSEHRIELEGIDGADLLVALGNELVYLFEVEGFLAARLEVLRASETALCGVLHGDRFDPEEHPIARPVKAVTHHGARLEPVEDGLRARIVFDL
ncbi:MAG: archease [Planctomycetota bacterium]|nr:MAG: archease [Planctomycetota bacterium]